MSEGDWHDAGRRVIGLLFGDEKAGRAKTRVF